MPSVITRSTPWAPLDSTSTMLGPLRPLIPAAFNLMRRDRAAPQEIIR
ncbi:Uncharacterised protein [Serratia fonticola]|uniref:Uncharacterized protein n=1 Tax=Serratia fonticola TaxID=47917 RepID=A0A4U9WGJ1_SERFO|nr:Uncharacterised protein [Serratia fonticola]